MSTLGPISPIATCRASDRTLCTAAPRPPVMQLRLLVPASSNYAVATPAHARSPQPCARRSLSHRADDAAGSGISRLIKPAACASRQSSSGMLTPQSATFWSTASTRLVPKAENLPHTARRCMPTAGGLQPGGLGREHHDRARCARAARLRCVALDVVRCSLLAADGRCG